jgi:hypothetical protein
MISPGKVQNRSRNKIAIQVFCWPRVAEPMWPVWEVPAVSHGDSLDSVSSTGTIRMGNYPIGRFQRSPIVLRRWSNTGDGILSLLPSSLLFAITLTSKRFELSQEAFPKGLIGNTGPSLRLQPTPVPEVRRLSGLRDAPVPRISGKSKYGPSSCLFGFRHCKRSIMVQHGLEEEFLFNVIKSWSVNRLANLQWSCR